MHHPALASARFLSFAELRNPAINKEVWYVNCKQGRCPIESGFTLFARPALILTSGNKGTRHSRFQRVLVRNDRQNGR